MQKRGGWGSGTGARVAYVSTVFATPSSAPLTPSQNSSANAAKSNEQYFQLSAEEAEKTIPGLRIVKDFVSKEEEENLLRVTESE